MSNRTAEHGPHGGRALQEWDVHVRFKHPAPGSVDDRPLRVVAHNRSEAIKSARQDMSLRGYGHQDGPIKYRARLVRADEPEQADDYNGDHTDDDSAD